jgi:hypothetical protein
MTVAPAVRLIRHDMAVDDGALRATDQRTDDRVRLTGIADLEAFRHRNEALT